MAGQFLSPIPFLYQGEHLVRIVIGPDREPWFVAGDLCRILNIKHVPNAVERLDKDEKSIADVVSNDSRGQRRGVWIVSEAGFFTLSLSSRKPEAITFRRWVTHEVLPSIRRTGGYQLSSERADKAWTDRLTAVRLSVAELRRSYGPRKAALLGADLWRKVDVIVDDPLPPQRKLDLDNSDESNVIDMRPDEAG